MTKNKLYPRLFWVLPPLPLFLLVGGAGFFISLIFAGKILVAGIIGIAAGLVAVIFFMTFSKPLIARRIGLRSLHPKKDVSIILKIEALCLAHGLMKPKLAIIASKKINAVAFGLRKNKSTLAVTYGTHKNLEAVEIESVLAHKLSRIRLGITCRETYVVALLKLPFGNLFNALCQKLISTNTILAADIDGVKLTLYPPGLIATLTQMCERTESTDVVGTLSAFKYCNQRLSALREFWEM